MKSSLHIKYNHYIIYQTSTPIRTLLQKKKPLISYNKTLHGSVAMDLFNTPPPKPPPPLWVKQTIFVRVAKHPICSFVTCTPCNLLIKGVKKKTLFLQYFIFGMYAMQIQKKCQVTMEICSAWLVAQQHHTQRFALQPIHKSMNIEISHQLSNFL